MGWFLQLVLALLLSVTAVFLILLVLIQRGRGGGLAGAFGGAGGQSAFGTKAGDLFTRITIGAAAFWLVLCAISDKLLSSPTPSLSSSLGKQVTAPAPGAAQGPGTQQEPAPSAETGAPAAGGQEKKAVGEGEAGAAPPSSVPAGPDTKSSAGESAKAVLDAGSESLPPGSLGPNGALLPQQPPPAAAEPAPAEPKQ